MMKLIPILVLSLLIRVAAAQVTVARLDQDPVFEATLARRLSYPVDAEQQGVYAKIYAGFRIDHKGHIQDVSILNPARIGYGFEKEVFNRLQRLPPLHPRYEGLYALPVTFAIIDYADGAKAVSSSGKLPDWFHSNRTLLKELKVIGRSDARLKSRYVPLSRGQVLAIDP